MKLDNVIAHFKLGNCLDISPQIHGGQLHQNCNIRTDKGHFFIKCFNSDLAQFQAFEQCEAIARRFQKVGITTCAALTRNRVCLFQDEKQFIAVYPFIEGKVLSADTLTATHRNTIANLLARMHACALTGLNAPPVAKLIVTPKQWQDLLKTQTQWQGLLTPYLEPLEIIHNLHTQHRDTLEKNLCISHRDLTPSNIIWQQSKPTIIDWELAGWINPTVEAINVALDQAFEKTGINIVQFRLFLENYLSAGGQFKTPLNQARFATAASWAHWIAFIIRDNHHRIPPEKHESLIQRALIAIDFLLNPKSIDYLDECSTIPSL